jgi:hypothetical protein
MVFCKGDYVEPARQFLRCELQPTSSEAPIFNENAVGKVWRIDTDNSVWVLFDNVDLHPEAASVDRRDDKTLFCFGQGELIYWN